MIWRKKICMAVNFSFFYQNYFPWNQFFSNSFFCKYVAFTKFLPKMSESKLAYIISTLCCALTWEIFRENSERNCKYTNKRIKTKDISDWKWLYDPCKNHFTLKKVEFYFTITGATSLCYLTSSKTGYVKEVKPLWGGHLLINKPTSGAPILSIDR